MANAAHTSGFTVKEPGGFYPKQVAIKSAEIINHGDLVGIDTNGQVVASSKAATPVKASWIAFFDDENGMATSRTGVAGLTVKTGLCKRARITYPSATAATQVPSIDNGLPVFLGEYATATVSNYTCARTSTNTDLLQQVGFVEDDALTLNIDLSSTITEIKYQSAATSTVNLA